MVVGPYATANMGADLNLTPIGNAAGTGTLDLRGVLNANGYAISAGTAYLGYYGGPFSITNRGPLTVGSLYVSSQYSPARANFSFAAGDTATNLHLFGIDTTLPAGAAVTNLYINLSASTVNTTTVGNLSGSVTIGPGNTLTLGADLQLSTSGTLGLGGTLNADGHAISVGALNLGLASNYALNNRGSITANSLGVSSEYSPAQTTFNLTASDHVQILELAGVSTVLPAGVSLQWLYLSSNGAASPIYATANTTAAGNITRYASVGPGCTLALGADLNIQGNVDLNGILNANGHAVSVFTATFGDKGGPVAIENDGRVTANTWTQTGGSHLELHQPGDTLGTLLLSSNSTLTVGDAAGQTTGLTISGRSSTPCPSTRRAI